MKANTRADVLVARMLNISRNKSSEMIQKQLVLANNAPIKPSTIIDDANALQIIACEYVSRAAHKLRGLLDDCSLDISGAKCLDVGSSTGGFAQILLERGAASIDCVDVGSDQLHPTLRDNPRIHLYENTDIRRFVPSGAYDFVFVDVSFISVYEIWGALMRFLLPTSASNATNEISLDGAQTSAINGTTNEIRAKPYLVVLFKPQFEVGKQAKRTKKGVVKDQKLIKQKLDAFSAHARAHSLRKVYSAPSKLLGKEGNAEYFFVFAP